MSDRESLQSYLIAEYGEQIKEVAKLYESNRENYGHYSATFLATENWGTKWDAFSYFGNPELNRNSSEQLECFF